LLPRNYRSLISIDNSGVSAFLVSYGH
jgi:hypothetical protein